MCMPSEPSIRKGMRSRTRSYLAGRYGLRARNKLLRWTPTLAQAGPQTVVLKATDAAGNEAQQSFSVVVSTESSQPFP